MARIQEVVIDCADPAALAAFWAEILDVRWGLLDDGWAVVEADPVLIGFQKVPEPKSSAKNRVHLDIEVPDAHEAVERAARLGATPTGWSELDPTGDGYTVLRDPEGNEFCFVVDRAGGWDRALRRALDD